MTYTIENTYLKVSVDTLGAELVSIIDKASGREVLWQKDHKIWGRQAPVLFPYVGRLKGGRYELDGNTYVGKPHGFIKDLEHTCIEQSTNSLHFIKEADEKTLSLFPRRFLFETIFSLDGHTLRQKVRISNLDTRTLRFGLGFHPGFALPFDNKHTTADYELRFDTAQTPIVSEIELEGDDIGLSLPSSHPLCENNLAIELHDRLFENDSLTLTKLSAKTLSLVEKDTGRKICVGIANYPNVLLWSAITPTMRFICIEPWAALQDAVDASGQWEDKPCAAKLTPKENWETDLVISFEL